MAHHRARNHHQSDPVTGWPFHAFALSCIAITAWTLAMLWRITHGG
jgi:hypothetical protein